MVLFVSTVTAEAVFDVLGAGRRNGKWGSRGQEPQ